jgi:uncharacterized protein (TIGR02646 family)
MRYIQKTEVPQFFIDNTENKSKWEEYPTSKKPLKEYILKNEQNYLCIYCESRINLNNSHIEHIKPKAQNMYPDLVFNYNNIVVSCNGNCHTENNTHYTCGHIKDNEYDNSKFLNPVKLIDIRDYFVYDIDEGKIEPSEKNNEKAEYMINTLYLNDGELPKARKKALENFINQMKKISNIRNRKEKMKRILNDENIAFISFVKYKYASFL